jgi:alkylation response protein AidB-like acyl-CoA dehydrogenase
MDPYFNDDHRALIHRVRSFAEEAIVPVARELDHTSTFPWENVRAMGEEGFLGVPIPKAYGGQELDALSYLLVVQELARHDASHAITVSAHTTLGTTPILRFGSPEQRDRYVPRLAKGEVLGGFGLTEPGAGSDASGSRTRAVRENDGWRLNGSKIFITHAGVGEIFTVTAVTEPETKDPGDHELHCHQAHGIPRGGGRVGMGRLDDLGYTPGVRAGKKEDKMGWRASDTRELLLEDAFVPDDHRVGERGKGFINFMKTLDSGRIGIAALSLGIGRGSR